jgi:phenylacetate-CoA ligase
MGLYTSPAYLRSPVWAQELLLSARGWARSALRSGRSFDEEVADLGRTEWLDEEKLAALQFVLLKHTLEHAAAHVPFYRARFKSVGFDPKDLRTLADMQRIPVLTKREVFDAGAPLLSTAHRGPRFSSTSSGTTGLPLTGWRDLRSINRENALVWRQLRWAGMRFGDRRVWMRGDKVVPSGQKAPPFWRHNRGEQMLMMSSYHLSEKTADSYLAAVEDFNPVVIQAYPSAILFLARHLDNNGRKYRGRALKSVVTSSETVTEEHRQLVCRAFGCRIFDSYGSLERMARILTCEHGHYHIMSDFSYTELMPQRDGTSEVVGTTFDNMLMPWIRYRLDDAIVPTASSERCECGRSFPMIERIVGRIEDYVLAPDGRRVFMMSNVLDEIPDLLEGQIRQDSHDELTFLLVLAPGAELDERALRRAVYVQLGEGMRITVQRVNAVPRTSNGKLRAVVRTVN